MSDERSWVPDWRQVEAVAEKEFLDNVRSKWIVVMTVLFVALTLLFSVVAAMQAGQGARLSGFRATALGMVGTVGLLVPILALMLSYAAVAGERESGSLNLLLTMPVTRLEVLIGKFVGLGCVLAFALLTGLGVSAAFIVAAAGTAGLDAFFVFLAGSILMSLAFLSIGLFFSSLVQRRSTALGLAVFLWFFFNLIYDTVLFGVFFATGGSFPSGPNPQFVFPDWYYAAQLFNPGDAFGLLAEKVFAASAQAGFGGVLPGFVTIGAALASIVSWIAVPFALAQLRFKGLDL